MYFAFYGWHFSRTHYSMSFHFIPAFSISPCSAILNFECVNYDFFHLHCLRLPCENYIWLPISCLRCFAFWQEDLSSTSQNRLSYLSHDNCRRLFLSRWSLWGTCRHWLWFKTWQRLGQILHHFGSWCLYPTIRWWYMSRFLVVSVFCCALSSYKLVPLIISSVAYFFFQWSHLSIVDRIRRCLKLPNLNSHGILVLNHLLFSSLTVTPPRLCGSQCPTFPILCLCPTRQHTLIVSCFFD